MSALVPASAARTYDGLPSPSLLAAVVRRRSGLRGSDTIPSMAAHARGVPASSHGRDAHAYARICGFADRPDAVPPTWPQVLGAPLHLALFGAPEFPLPVLGIVHVAQRIQVLRPIRPDETLDVHANVSGHRIVRAGAEFDLHTDVHAGGALVWQGVSTILSRAVRGSGPRQVPERPQFRPTRSTTVRVRADTGRRYGAIAGDRNPIHLYGWTARLFGFPRAIAHGMWTLARALAELDTDVPERCTIEARFLKPVLLPSRILVEGGPLQDGTGHGFHVLSDKREACVTGTVQPLA